MSIETLNPANNNEAPESSVIETAQTMAKDKGFDYSEILHGHEKETRFQILKPIPTSSVPDNKMAFSQYELMIFAKEMKERNPKANISVQTEPSVHILVQPE